MKRELERIEIPGEHEARERSWAVVRTAFAEREPEPRQRSWKPVAVLVGAAALVPYAALRRMVVAGKTAKEIARHFNVSRELVEYRIKVSRLWDEYARRVASG